MDRRLLAFVLIAGGSSLCFALAVDVSFGWPRAETWSAAVEAELVAEIEDATELPAWAGVYSGSRLQNCWEKLVLAPSGRFTWHSSCCMVTDEREGGRLEVRGDQLRLVSSRPIEDPLFREDLRLIVWGEDRYLLELGEESQLVNLNNTLTGEPEPSLRTRWIGVLRDGPRNALGLPDGHPNLEGVWRGRLLHEPVIVRCVEVTEETEGCALRFDAGSESGLWKGQRLWLVDADEPLDDWVLLDDVESQAAWGERSCRLAERFEGRRFTTHPHLVAEQAR